MDSSHHPKPSFSSFSLFSYPSMMEPSFPQFRLLPAELRYKIWQFALPRRTVKARLKLDLDAWNAATEVDWMQVHYRVVSDGRTPPLPRLVLVNHEAWCTISKSYRPMKINRDALTRSLGTRSVDDAVFDAMHDSVMIARLNPECDVLEWAEPRRWGTGDRELPCPLFLAACLSVRHVSVEYEASMYTQLEILALAVLDQDQPLETLTIGLSVDVFLKKWEARFRLARSPPGPRLFLENEEDWGRIGDILSRHSACFIPWHRTGGIAGEIDGVQGPHPLVNETLTKGYSPAQTPLLPGTRLGTRFSIYKVLQPGRKRDKSQIGMFAWGSPLGSNLVIADCLGNPHCGYGEDIQVDILLWLTRLRVNFERSRLVIPFHGFCRPEYGLPQP